MNVRHRAVLLAAVPPLLLTACSAGPTKGEPVSAASTAAASGHNDEDVMFLQMMVAHHEQGLEMVSLAADRAGRKEVRTLAAAIKATQSEEAKLMSSWLGQWSKPAKADPSANAHLYHGGEPGTGPKEIAALKRSKGAGFEPAFLSLFIAHQHNAVKMARTEQAEGVNPGTKALAGRVVTSRTAEIRQMLRLLNS